MNLGIFSPLEIRELFHNFRLKYRIKSQKIRKNKLILRVIIRKEIVIQ